MKTFPSVQQVAARMVRFAKRLGADRDQADAKAELSAHVVRMHHTIERLTRERDAALRVALSAGVRDALVLSRDVLMARCGCRAHVTGRGLALDAINRELKAAGYVWRQGVNGPELVMPHGGPTPSVAPPRDAEALAAAVWYEEERRRTGRSGVDPHAGMNPTLTERRGKDRA